MCMGVCFHDKEILVGVTRSVYKHVHVRDVSQLESAGAGSGTWTVSVGKS